MIRGKDIAEKVGVSRQAVTAVLNGSRPNCVSKEKREAILRIASENRYRPNHAAVALKTGKSNLIGVVMPPLDNIYISELCMGLYKIITKYNYVPLFVFFDLRDPDPALAESILSRHVAGLISVHTSYLPDSIDIPVVSYYYDDPRFDSISPDLEKDIDQIVDYLQNCGQQKIGYIGLKNDRRHSLLAAALEKRRIAFPDRFFAVIENNDICQAFDRLLEQNSGRDLPQALLIHNDTMAIKLMHHIVEKGFRIPEDFSLIGHDDIALCAAAMPPLTTVSFGSPAEIAEKMVLQLLKRIKNPDLPRKKLLLDPQLVVRKSVKSLK